MCIDVGPVEHMKNIRFTLIDPDTPQDVMERKNRNGGTQKLVVRTFLCLDAILD